MKQKLFTVLFFILFIGVFGYLYGGEYREFYDTQVSEIQEQRETQERIMDFSVDDIGEIQGTELFVTPDIRVLDTLVKVIDNAEQRVYLEVYIFTEKRILESLKKAHNRGVEVRVILEQNPYLAPNLNNKRYTELEKIGIDVVWSDSSDYSLNHSKVLVVDDTAFISTGNMSYSTFTKNRDFIVQVDDVSIINSLTQVFEADYIGKQVSPYHDALVLSPSYSRSKLEHMMRAAQSSVHMYFQYLQDDEMLDVILEVAESGVQIEIVLDDDFYEENPEVLVQLWNAGVLVYKYPKSVMHAKAILVDEKYLFIGSINFSSYSFDQNREVGIILSDPQVIKDFLETFSGDVSG